MKKVHIYILTIILFASCNNTYQINSIVDSQQKFTVDYEKEDALIEHNIQPYRENLENSMNTIIAKASKNMNKAQPESTLGNLLADATFAMGAKYSNKKIDAAIINYGGIRVPSINKGNVTLGNVYEIMPFDNYLVVLEISGKTLQDVCNIIAAKGGWPISGISFKIVGAKASDIKINGENLNETLLYTIAISDYLAGGGDNLAMLKDIAFENTNILLRDAFIEYFKIEQNLNAELENRISNE